MCVCVCGGGGGGGGHLSPPPQPPYALHSIFDHVAISFKIVVAVIIGVAETKSFSTCFHTGKRGC